MNRKHDPFYSEFPEPETFSWQYDSDFSSDELDPDRLREDRYERDRLELDEDSYRPSDLI